MHYLQQYRIYMRFTIYVEAIHLYLFQLPFCAFSLGNSTSYMFENECNQVK